MSSNSGGLLIENGTPYSTQYEDIYFSRDNGLAESRHVYIAGNNLPAAWRNRDRFVIAETGFGTGLNFLATWQQWRACSNRPATLHYLSIEKHPLSALELAACHRLFPELTPYARALAAVYPVAYPGFHRIHLDDHRVRLTLCFGEVTEMLEQIVAQVDCWYLDGFAPSKNPAMWSNDVFRQVARLSNDKATLATFTVAGHIRRGLSEQGFAIKKVAGFAGKREITVGEMQDRPAIRDLHPWFKPPVHSVSEKSAVVLGAGIGGAQIAWHLAIRGWQVSVIERRAKPGLEGSGNPLAVIAPLMTSTQSPAETFSVQCFLAAVAQMRHLGIDAETFSPCGMLDLAANSEQLQRRDRLLARQLPEQLLQRLDPEGSANVAGISLSDPAIHYPSAGWVQPAGLIERLLSHPGIRVICGAEVVQIDNAGDRWAALGGDQKMIAQGQTMIIATGGSLGFNQTKGLPVTPVYGQTSLATSSSFSDTLKKVLQYQGYITPAQGGTHILGATYQHDAQLVDNDDWANQQNLQMLASALPELARSLGPISRAHGAIRATTNNRMPLIGPVPDEAQFSALFPLMQRRSYRRLTDNPEYLPGLFIGSAWGSRGMTNTALGADLLGAIINDEPLPVQRDLYYGAHPARFLVGHLKRI